MHVFKESAEVMLSKGYAFDYISDKQVWRTNSNDNSIITEGNSKYQTLVLPHCKYIPLTTLTKILSLVEAGCTVIMPEGPPSGLSGNNNPTTQPLDDLIAKVATTPEIKGVKTIVLGKGKIFAGSDLNTLLQIAGIRFESMVREGIQFIRKTSATNKPLYLISNGDTPYEGWISLQARGRAASIYNPMTGDVGVVQAKGAPENTAIFVKLNPRETLFIEVLQDPPKTTFPFFFKPAGEPFILEGPWSLEFTDGGPQLPATIKMETLKPWTSLNDTVCKSFSGSAMYATLFAKPKQKSRRWLLDFGAVDESAEVILNGQSLGIMLGPSYQVYIDDAMLKEKNDLKVQVCNLMANRISYMDQRGIFWKKFYNVNFPSRKAENRKDGLFDASHWSPRVSGLGGPVRVFAVEPY